jgi:hypothetical protein
MFQLLWWKKRHAGDTQPGGQDRIARDLSELASRMLASLIELERAHKSAQTALPYAIDEAEKSRHVDRKARFVRYRDVLTSSSTQLDGLIEQLRSAHELCLTLEGVLRSGHLDPTTGQAEFIAIRQVIQSLENEDLIDDVWLRGIRSITREFDVVLRERDRKKVEEKYSRLGFKTKWEDAAAEKKRKPKPTGHRDSWNPQS